MALATPAVRHLLLFQKQCIIYLVLKEKQKMTPMIAPRKLTPATTAALRHDPVPAEIVELIAPSAGTCGCQ
jgi:hypothetical protein